LYGCDTLVAMSHRTHKIAVIAGDGIGPEVIDAGLAVLRAAASADGGFTLDPHDYPWGCSYLLQTGAMMPADALDTLRGYDAIYLGACGWPTVPDHVSLWGLLLPIRQRFELYVNLRPVRLLPGLEGPLRNRRPQDIDFICIRENTEGEYSGTGGRVHAGLPEELAVEVPVFTRRAVERIVRYAFTLAAQRPRRRLSSVTKSNASRYAYVLWDEVVADVARDFPSVAVERVHVDAMAARFVARPDTLDVVVGSNLFADILTDLGGAIQGSLGLAASANLNPERTAPSLFEPVHGSAPDIAGKGIANPIGAIWAGALMLEHLGETAAAARVIGAIETVIAAGKPRTPDLGGSDGTRAVTEAVVAAVGAPVRATA
jgi:tartrate dehydrogenase/decarboxylase/D-malate dehydrogenase